MVLILSSIVGLIVATNYWLIVTVQVTLTVSLIALGVILTKKLHDELPSKLRAGSASVVSTLARLLIIPGVLLFTTVGERYSVSSATYGLLGIAALSIVAYVFIAPAKRASISGQCACSHSSCFGAVIPTHSTSGRAAFTAATIAALSDSENCAANGGE